MLDFVKLFNKYALQSLLGAGLVFGSCEVFSSQLPDIQVYSLKGRRIQALHDVVGKGRLTLATFFKQSCIPCMRQLREYQCLREKNPGIDILALSLDPKAKSKRYFQRFRPDFDIVLVSNSSLSHFGQIPGTPYSLVIGRDGDIRERIFGYLSCEQMNQLLLLSPTVGK